jgi:hypothetical protein
MITNCNRCGNYTIILGQELAGARAVVKKLRLDLKNAARRFTVIRQYDAVNQLLLEIDLLSADIARARPQLLERAELVAA